MINKKQFYYEHQFLFVIMQFVITSKGCSINALINSHQILSLSSKKITPMMPASITI